MFSPVSTFAPELTLLYALDWFYSHLIDCFLCTLAYTTLNWPLLVVECATKTKHVLTLVLENILRDIKEWMALNFLVQ